MTETPALTRRMIGVKELAAYLGIRPQTVYNQVCLGKFPIRHKRLGRLLRWDINEVNLYLDNLPANQ